MFLSPIDISSVDPSNHLYKQYVPSYLGEDYNIYNIFVWKRLVGVSKYLLFSPLFPCPLLPIPSNLGEGQTVFGSKFMEELRD